jgi:carbon-monoxide dehydrogenase medium subunit
LIILRRKTLKKHWQLCGNGLDAKILAGGQSLPLLNLRLTRPKILVDLNGVSGLDHIRETRSLRIGAMARQSRVERSSIVQERCPLLAEAILAYRPFGHPPPRHHRWKPGSRRSPRRASAVALALDAKFEVLGMDGSRRLR